MEKRSLLLGGLTGLAGLAALVGPLRQRSGTAFADEKDEKELEEPEKEKEDADRAVRWAPETLNVRLLAGTSQTVQVRLRVDEAIAGAQVIVSPTLRPFLTAVQLQAGTAATGISTASGTSTPTPTPSPSPTPQSTGSAGATGSTTVTTLGTISAQRGDTVRLQLDFAMAADANKGDEARGVLALVRDGVPLEKALRVRLRVDDEDGEERERSEPSERPASSQAASGNRTPGAGGTTQTNAASTAGTGQVADPTRTPEAGGTSASMTSTPRSSSGSGGGRSHRDDRQKKDEEEEDREEQEKRGKRDD